MHANTGAVDPHSVRQTVQSKLDQEIRTPDVKHICSQMSGTAQTEVRASDCTNLGAFLTGEMASNRHAAAKRVRP
jgi:hypothetical protein